MKRILPFHPFLFGLYPILFLFANNVNQVTFLEVLVPLGIVLALTIFLLTTSRRFIKEGKKGALLVSLILILCFSYGHVVLFIQNLPAVKFITAQSRYLFSFWCLLFLLGAYLILKTKRNLETATLCLNMVALFLVAISIFQTGTYMLKTWSTWQNLQKPSEIQGGIAENLESNPFPDIYYLVFDRYASADTLERIYDFDNHEFLDFLKRRGFYLASESKANYMSTHHSLASSLNMSYLDFLAEKYGEESDNLLPIFEMMKNHQVGRFLKSKGYTFVHLGSFYEPTRKNQYADVEFNFYPIPEFSMMVYQTTIFYPVSVRLRLLDFRYLQWQRVQYKFEKMAEIADMPGPKFVFTHMLTPHGPFVFGKKGEYITEEEASKKDSQENYINQLIFINKKIEELLNQLLSNRENPPIIILQSDEGKYPARYWLEGDDFNWEQANPAELEEKLGILNAYYLPKIEEGVLYPSISPVNSFRLIFSLYFGANLELLPDEYYVYQDSQHPYKFNNVTDKLD